MAVTLKLLTTKKATYGTGRNFVKKKMSLTAQAIRSSGDFFVIDA